MAVLFSPAYGAVFGSVGAEYFLWRLFFMVCLGSVGKFWMDECLEAKVSGSWLKEFGFEYGHKVVVEITKGQIVIKAVDVEDMDAVEGEEV